MGFYGSSLQKSVYWFALFSDRSEDSRIADDHGISVWTLWKNASTVYIKILANKLYKDA